MQCMKLFCILRLIVLYNWKLDVFVCFSWRGLSSQASVWIRLHEDRWKILWLKMRWGIWLHISAALAVVFSMHVCLAFYALERTKIHKDGEKMLWSKPACGKVFISIIAVAIIFLVCTNICHPQISLLPSGKRLNKFFRAGFNPHLNSTPKTYRKQVKRSFCRKSSAAHAT